MKDYTPKKYSLPKYKRDNILHETTYYQVFKNNLIINSSCDRDYIYNYISFKKREDPKAKYMLYKITTQRIKHYPNETL